MKSRAAHIVVAALLTLACAGCSSDPAPEGGDGADSGELRKVEGTYVNPDSVALSPDGSRIAVPCDGQICVWDTADGGLVDTWEGGSVVAWSPSGDVLATDGLDGDTVFVSLLDPSTGDEERAFDVHRFAVVEDQPGGGLLDLSFAPDGRTLAGVGGDGVVRLWSVGDPDEVFELDLNAEKPVAVAFSPDGSRLAVASSDAPVTIHDVATGEQVASLQSEPQGAVAWSADGAFIATAAFALDDDAATMIWDAEDMTVLAQLPQAGGEIAFAPSSDRLALSVKNETDVLVWDWAADDVSTLSGATDGPRAVRWAPDASVLYAVSARDAVLAWDPAGGTPTRFDKPGED